MSVSRFSSPSRPLSVFNVLLMGIFAAILFGFGGLLNTFPSTDAARGFCLPSPNLWEIPQAIGWGINTGLLILCAAVWVFLNKEYTVVKGTDQLTVAAFLLLVGADPVCTGHLTTGAILLTISVFCLAVLFGTAHERNSTHRIFAIFTFLSIGTMFQYAFLPMMIVFLLGAIIMKAMRAKEFMAMILGIVAPYWVVVGLGIISPESFRLPEVAFFFSEFRPVAPEIVLLVNLALSLLLAVILSISNSMVIYAGNKETRARNNVITLFNFLTALFIICDYTNKGAWLATFYFTLAVQIANLFAYHSLPWRRTILWSFASLYIIGFVLMAIL